MIIVKQRGNVLEIRFKTYMDRDVFRDVVDRIKSIEGRKFNGDNKNDTYWTIPVSQRLTLQKLFTPKEIVIEDDTKEETVIIPPKAISTDMTHLDELLLTPYPFQIIGINFLCDVGCGMLADEMGLGKTAELLGSIYRLYRMGKVKRALIVCPATLKYQWEDELQKFIDVETYGVDYVIVDGSVKEREAIYDSLKKDDVLYTIVNYELVRNDIARLKELNFDVIALDEAHRIRNWKSKTSEAIEQLNATYKWAATGTPLQNKPEELYNIFKWINPDVLGNWWKFRGRYIIIGEKFGQPNMVLGYKNLGELHQKISPFMLRRLKKDVAPELPEILVNNYHVEMTPTQIKLHNTIREELIDLIKEVSKHTVRNEDGDIIKEHPRAAQINGLFVMLQEVCDCPGLLVMSDSKLSLKFVPEGSRSTIDIRSPKIIELVSILSEFKENYSEGNTPKAVIFTQFERMQRLIVDAISPLGGVRIVNGTMGASEKQDSIREFKSRDDINFLVCTDSANYGVNLQEASLLVNVDLPWNPAVWDQRNARIHRLSSTYKSVNIVNLISVGGLDERILEALYSKKETASEIVENREQEQEYLSGLTHSLMTKLLSTKKHKNRRDSK